MERRKLTNGLVEIEPLELYWKPDEKKWTPGQLNVFQQGSFFDSKEKLAEIADRVPWQFRLKYREIATGSEFDGKILAWSYYQGYRRERGRLGDETAALKAVVAKIEKSIFSDERTVFAILGTHSRFGNWMISALYHLPTSVREFNQGQGRLLWKSSRLGTVD